MNHAFIIGVSLARIGAIGIAPSPGVWAAPVGEIHRVATEQTATLWDAGRRAEVRITIWYPGASYAVEQQLTVGPTDRPLFNIGAVAANAPIVEDGAQHPVILLSHGFGGSARSMGWLGIAMARRGYLVIAIDHPGNYGRRADDVTKSGSVVGSRQRPPVYLEPITRDPLIGPRMHRSRVGVAGFSDGGFTALVVRQLDTRGLHDEHGSAYVM